MGFDNIHRAITSISLSLIPLSLARSPQKLMGWNAERTPRNEGIDASDDGAYSRNVVAWNSSKISP